MTIAKARVIFASHMQTARTRKLTKYELDQLSKARQVLRQSRKPNPRAKRIPMTKVEIQLAKELMKFGFGKSEASQLAHMEYEMTGIPSVKESTARIVKSVTHRSVGGQRNPKRVLIYGNVQTIYAKKTQPHVCDDECKAHGHRYYHDFSSKPKMYGLPNGDLLITTR